MQESHRHFCLFKCCQWMLENVFGDVLTFGGFNLLILTDFSKEKVYNMGEGGWEVYKKVLSLMPNNLSYQLLQASLRLSFFRV